MNELTKTAADTTTVGDLRALAEDDHPIVPGDRRPSVELLSILLGRGKDGCVALFRQYEEAIPREEAVEVLKALAALARHARSRGVVAWTLDDVRPIDEERARFLLTVPAHMDERMRALAQAEGMNVSEFIREAIAQHCDAVEKGRPSAATASA